MSDAQMTTAQIARAVGTRYKNVDHWTRIGILEPTVEAAGSGTQRAYEPIEADVARMCVALKDLLGNCPRRLARELAEGVRAGIDAHLCSGAVSISWEVDDNG